MLNWLDASTHSQATERVLSVYNCRAPSPSLRLFLASTPVSGNPAAQVSPAKLPATQTFGANVRLPNNRFAIVGAPPGSLTAHQGSRSPSVRGSGGFAPHQRSARGRACAHWGVHSLAAPPALRRPAGAGAPSGASGCTPFAPLAAPRRACHALSMWCTVVHVC